MAELLSLFGIGVVALLVWAALAPFEALGWWAGWFGHKIYEPEPASDRPIPRVQPDPSCYILYLSGISNVSGETLSRREQNFLGQLAAAMPDAVLIDDVFPYSVNNLPLTGQPVFAGLWRWALARKFSDHWLERLAGYLINIRNIWQVAISADRRYGPIYNQAMAQVLLHNLLRFGYEVESGLPVILIGYSGAGQIAIGATTYLKELIRGPVYVVSLGGIFGSDPGLLAADRVFHLYGSKDRPQKLGQILFPGRWPLLWYSPWNQARRTGRILTICLGPMAHAGGVGYMTSSHYLPNGLAHVEKTVQAIANLPFQPALAPALR